MQKNNLRIYVISFWLIILTYSLSAQPIFTKTLSAKGRSEVVITIKEWGRYSLEVKSSEGVSLEVMDRLRGIFARNGQIGQKDGRVDLFLDAGEYKLISQGPANAQGQIAISATRFTGRETEEVLVPQKQESAQLRDKEQIHWWIVIPKDTLVYLEALGRHLEELVLFKDGEWVEEISTEQFINKFTAEKPLQGIRVIQFLQRGRYKVVFYGGEKDGYAVQDSASPLYVQYGLRKLGSSQRLSMKVGPSGVCRFVISNEAHRAVVECPEKKRLLIEHQSIAGSGRLHNNSVDSIHAKSATSSSVLDLYGSNQKVISIYGEPGTQIIVTTLSTSNLVNAGSGKYLVSTLHTGNYTDNIGATGAIIETRSGSIIALQADTISSEATFKRKFNLLGTVTTLLWVDEEASYTFEPGGTDMLWRVKRYFYNYPKDYEEPKKKKGKSEVRLNKGLHVLELYPENKGVATFLIRKSSAMGMLKKGLGLSEADIQFTKPRPSILFSFVSLNVYDNPFILLNSQFLEMSTLISQRFPLELKEPLTVTLLPGQKLEIPIKLEQDKYLSIRTANDKKIKFKLDNEEYDGLALVKAGEHSINMEGNNDLYITIGTKERREVDDNADAEVKSEVLPELKENKSSFIDLTWNAKKLYRFDIKEAGIYRFETTGRLHTALAVRDRFNSFKRSETGNGIGRNALIINYFLPGSYLLQVKAENKSAGRLGVVFQKGQLQSGGTFENAIDKKHLVDAFGGVVYTIQVPENGRYRVESFGQAGSYKVRLEDAQAWPVLEHGAVAPLETELLKGTYKLYSLPVDYEGRRISRIQRMMKNEKVKGAGPHVLWINHPVSAEWVEKKGTESVKYELKVPAAMELIFILSPGFIGEVKPKNKESVLLSVNGKKKMSMKTGEYDVFIRPPKRSNYAPYSISVTTSDLADGLHYKVNRSKMMRVQVGQAGAYEFFSQGMLDVSATLYGEDAKTEIAYNDDGFLDWNFIISKQLKPGRYFLKILGENAGFSETEVFMRHVKDTLFSPITLESSVTVRKFSLDGKQVTLPLILKGSGDVLFATILSGSRTACILETQGDITAQQHGMNNILAVPYTANANYALKVWSEDHIDETVDIAIGLRKAERFSLADAKKGIEGRAENEKQLTQFYKIDLSGSAPSHYTVQTSENSIAYVSSSKSPGRMFNSESGSFVYGSGKELWLQTSFEKSGKFRFTLEPMKIPLDNSMTIYMKGNKPRVFEFDVPERKIGLVTFTMNPGRPLAGIYNEHVKGKFERDGINVKSGQYTGDGMCLVAALSGEHQRLVVWNAARDNSADGLIAGLKKEYRTFENGGKYEGGPLVWDGQANSAMRYRIVSSKRKLLRLKLPPETGCLYIPEDKSRELVFGGDEGAIKMLTAENGDIYLFNGNSGGAVEIESFSGGFEKTETLVSGSELQRTYSVSGLDQIAVKSDDNNANRVFYSGEVANIDWLNNKGLITTNQSNGGKLDGNDGDLFVQHGIGPVKISICKADLKNSDLAVCRWGSEIKKEGHTLLKENSILKLKEGVNWFSVEVAETTHVCLNAPITAAVIRVTGETVDYFEAWESFLWNLPLSPGKFTFGIKSLAGSSISGSDLTVTFNSVAYVSEKKPFEAFLAPQENRLVRFEITEKSIYGIGVGMSSENAHVSLLNEKGEVIGTGKQQFLSLDKGSYYVLISVPANSEGINVKVHVFGQDAPPGDPPEEVVRWIINGAQGERPTTQRSTAESGAPVLNWNEEEQVENRSMNDQSEQIEEENYESESNEPEYTDESEEEAYE